MTAKVRVHPASKSSPKKLSRGARTAIVRGKIATPENGRVRRRRNPAVSKEDKEKANKLVLRAWKKTYENRDRRVD